MNTAAMVATLALTAFVVDRAVASLLFVARYLKVSRRTDQESRALTAEYGRKVIFFYLTGSLSAVALLFVPVRILPPPSGMEPFITWLVLVAGADRIAQFLGTRDAPAPPAVKSGNDELHLTGTLTLDEPSASRLREAAER